MTYSKTTWVEGTTGITSARLNNIESGVEVGYNNAILYTVTIGSANAYLVTLSPAPGALTEGMCIAVKINADSTGISTINVNGLGAKGIKKANGNDVTNFKSGGIYTLRYNGANFQLLGEGGEYGSAGAGDVKVGVTFGTENGVATGTFTSDATAVTSDIIASKTAYIGGSKLTGTIPDRGAGGTKTPTASNITLPAGRYTSDIVISGVSVPAANVLTGTTIAETAGTMPNAAGDTASLASSISGTTLKLRASKGYRDGVDDNVTITDANFIAGNIPNTKSIFGMQGTLEHIDINGIIASYSVAAGGSISAGDFVAYVNMGALSVFKSVSSTYISVAQLDVNKVLITYTDYNSYYGYAVVATITGITISLGTTVAFNAAQTMYTSVCILSPTKAIVAWAGSGGYSAQAQVLTISGTSITAGTSTNLRAEENCSYSYITITAIDSTRALVGWMQGYVPSSMYQGHITVLYAPSTSITASTVAAIDGSGGGYMTVSCVDTNKAVAVWNSSGYTYARVVGIGASGATWGTSGSNQQWEGGPGNYSGFFALAKLSSGKAIITYSNGVSANTKTFTISGTSISFGALYSFDSGGSPYRTSVTALDSTTAEVAYEYKTSSTSIITRILTISGTVITTGIRSTLTTYSNGSASEGVSITISGANTALVAFQNRANLQYGTAVILPNNNVKKAASPDVTLGIATTGGATGALISVKKAY